MTRKSNWPVITVAALLTVACSLPPYMTGALAPQINQDIPLDASSLGFVMAMYWAAGTIGSWLTVNFAEILTDRTVMLIALLIVIGGLVAAAVLATQAWHLLALIGFTGLANGIGHAPANSQLQLKLPGGRQGFGFGVKQAAIPIASVLAGMSVPLLGVNIGWRWALIAGAALCIPILFVVLHYVEKEPRMGSTAETTGRSNMMPPLVRKKAICMSVITLFAAGSFATCGSLITTVADSRGWSVEGAAVALSVSSLLGALLRVVATSLPGYNLRRTFGLLVIMISLGAIGMLVMSIPNQALFIAGMFLVLGPGWAWPAIMHFVAAQLSEGHISAVTGIVQMTVSISSAGIPVVVGVLLVSYGVTVGWLFLFSMLLIAACWSARIWRSMQFFDLNPSSVKEGKV